MNKLLYLISTVCLLCIMSSCSDDNKYNVVMPVFAGFSVNWYNPDNHEYPTVGDTLVIEAAQSQKGNMINTTVYRWTVKSVVNGEQREWSPTRTNIVYDYDKSNPRLRYIIPAGTTGRIDISFDADYSFSADCHGITPSRREDPYIGTITTSASAILGHAVGNCSIQIL